MPRELKFVLDEELVKGGVGDQALGGYVATNIAYTSDDDAGSILASYVLVFSLYGELKRVVPTYIGGVMYRPLGLKARRRARFDLRLRGRALSSTGSNRTRATH